MERIRIWLEAHRWLAATLCAEGMLCYLLVVHVYPGAGLLVERLATWRAQRATLASVAAWEEERAGILRRSRALEERFAALYVSLPDSDQMSSILQVLQEQAGRHAVVLRQVRPSVRAAYEHHDALPLLVELQGPFHSIAAFVNAVEAARYLIQVRRLLLIRGEQPAGGLRAELSLHIIILKEKQGAS